MLELSRLPWLPLLAFVVACAAEPALEGPASPGDARFAAWPMPNSAGLGLPNEQSYDVLGGGEEQTVHDRVTGLDWQRTIDSTSFTWSAAQLHCAGLGYAGFGDWRVPTRIELVSLLDLSRTNPALALAAFPAGPSEWCWTSSPDAADSTRAWYVYFYFGYPDVDDRAAENRVRCVRSASAAAPASERYDVQPESVRDLATGLSWQRGVSEQSFTAKEAVAYCAGLTLGERAGFRVPTLKELQTLVDERRFQPAIDTEAFSHTPSERFWSSSAWSGSSDLAWYVRFDSGSALYDLVSEALRVRCVR